jgi:hypothetical protein
MPMTTGISTAAVPVLESTPLMRPTISMMATISPRSERANFVTRPPMSLATPVSNRAPPTTNIATNRITLLLTKPSKAAAGSSTPVSTRPIHTIIEVTPRGIFSRTNMTMANNRKSRVMTAGLMGFLLIPGTPGVVQLWVRNF